MNVGTKPRVFWRRICEYRELTGSASITKLGDDGRGSVGNGDGVVVVVVLVVVGVVGVFVTLVRVLFPVVGVAVVVTGAVVSMMVGGVGSVTGLVATGLVGGEVTSVVPSGGSPKEAER